MIKAEFFRKNGFVSGFTVSGHSGYDTEGRDIVCAAVSSAVQLTANLITETFRCKADVRAENNRVTVKADGSPDAAKLMEGLYEHLDLLSQQFEGTIGIKYTEV